MRKIYLDDSREKLFPKKKDGVGLALKKRLKFILKAL